jgi:hypothetical protein
MVWPAVKLHPLYSINFYEGLDILFEDLKLLNIDALRRAVTTKTLGHVSIVQDWLSVNTDTKVISIQGCKLNDSMWIVNKEGNGIVASIHYSCSDKDILTGIEYLYHMYNNLVVNS